jgi:CRISPR-associated endonuclease/helicase Cas3
LTYWAHSDPDGSPPEHPAAKWQRLSEHLENVAAIAGELAHAARPDDAPFRTSVELAGRLHDFGKYTDCFQNMIRSGEGRCQHSGHGAVIANDTGYRDAAFAIAGHHAGLPDNTGGAGTLDVRIKESRQEAQSLQARASEDCPPLSLLFHPSSARETNLTRDNFDLHTRILFSCLVDADRLDSGGRRPSLTPLNPEACLATLRAYIEALAGSPGDALVKKARQQVLEDCLNAADFPERLLSLTVPTGGGKTLSAMAFALRRAVLFPGAYRRIIVVIPYLSIIEQNAEVYSRVFGSDAILEHHSGSFDRLRQGADDKHFVPASPEKEETGYTPGALRTVTENWDAPLIVTTSVRFFESLFSNRPSDLRRVHNIARSVVILDEVQTLPRRLLAPLLSMIRELSDHWGCTFVFSTATQPAFQKPAEANRKDARWPEGTIREIVAEPTQLQTALKRVTIEWELDGTAGWAELAGRILDHPRVLCVVNLREHAGTLFDALVARADVGGAEECFHLSTRMCAAHRLKMLGRIKNRLDRKLPCRVISTQLIEAGVDLDFDVAFRAVGPLDAVLQAAGRADREGLLTARAGCPAGRLIVFRPDDERTPPNEYKEATGLTLIMAREALQLGQSIQPDSMERMARYWNRYYGDCDQGQALQDHRLGARFRTLAEEFEMISNRTLDVFVPYDDQARRAIDELRAIRLLTKELRQKLRRYTVGLQPYEFEKAKGVLEKIGKEGEIWAAVDGAYTESKGLKLELDAADNIV